MTTEQCSVDSILSPKNHAETFARQLQNRLRTLNNEIEKDGPEDTSWNGDQLSSSSDDIYYDLDSYPGSPAEEATETHFRDFINGKSSPSPHTATSTNSFLSNGNLVHHYQNVNGGQKVNKSEPDVMCYEYCTSGTLDDVISTSNDRLNDFSYCNGSPQMISSFHNHAYTNGNRDNTITDVNDFDCLHISQARNEHSEAAISDINDRLHCNGGTDIPIQSHVLEDKSKSLKENCRESQELDDFCCCYSSSDESQPVDVNSNLDTSNNVNKPLNLDNLTTLGLNVNYSVITNHEEEQKCSKEETNKKENYTEEDLCRLVDAVFLKTHEDQFDHCQSSEHTDETNRIDESRCDEEETIESKRSKFRRSSSLKTGKTPPGTPGCKKIVRFADVLGLDLADVRTFLDEIPKVPKSAFIDLKNVELSSSPPVTMLQSFMNHFATEHSMAPKVQRTIVPLFQQPSSRLEFLDRIRDNSVCLENAVVTDPILFVITGYVRVKNIDFNKSVHIRYSIDNWKSFADLQAKYVPNSCDGFSDKFTFVLYAHMLNVGQRLEFAVRYHASGKIFWDNNFGANYTFQCVPEGPTKVVLPKESYAFPTPVETWASFY